MNDYIEADWFGREGAFNGERVISPKEKTWKEFVDSRRMEITCGEAPYLVSRYDVSTGEEPPMENRVGMLDRKLRVVSENTEAPDEWLEWTYRTFQATYGYEFQSDNVLLARLNLLLTFDDYIAGKVGAETVCRGIYAAFEHRRVEHLSDGQTDGNNTLLQVYG